MGYQRNSATGLWEGETDPAVDPEGIRCKCKDCKRLDEDWQRQCQRNMIDDEVRRRRDEDWQ